jgi:uncharacterized protein (TIGR02001 family)
MIGTIARTASLGAASLLAALLLSGPALADGMPGRGKAAAPDYFNGGPCSYTANVGATTDNVYRGFTKSAEQAAVQGGFDVTCGRFYGGIAASSINFFGVASSEFDIYGGFRHKTGPITWDVGFIYYAFPDAFNIGRDIDYAELKVGASGEVWKDGTLGVTVYYSPDYIFESGTTWTVEAGVTQALPKFHMFSPTVSALIGYTKNEHDNFINGDDNYTYWNAGLTLGFHDRWAIDLRYWDTNIDHCDNGLFDLCGSRFVATAKYKF